MIERPNAQLLHFLVLCSVITGSPSESIDHHIIKAVLAFAQYGTAGHGFRNEFVGVHMVGVESVI